MTVNPADKCSLHIPHKSWAMEDPDAPRKDFENWKEVERWARFFHDNCLPSGGGITQAFVADSVGTSTITVTTGNSGNPEFRVSSTNSGRFQTNAVSDMSSAVTQVTVPAGFWDFAAQIDLEPTSTAPSSGYVDVMFDFINEWTRVPWSQIADPGATDELATPWLHRRYNLSSSSTIGFIVDNFTDQSIDARCKVFMGTQMAGDGDLALA